MLIVYYLFLLNQLQVKSDTNKLLILFLIYKYAIDNLK